MIGFDLANKKELFKSDNEKQFPNYVYDKTVVFKDSKVMMDDL